VVTSELEKIRIVVVVVKKSGGKKDNKREEEELTLEPDRKQAGADVSNQP
jgi:hypothetical protein